MVESRVEIRDLSEVLIWFLELKPPLVLSQENVSEMTHESSRNLRSDSAIDFVMFCTSMLTF